MEEPDLDRARAEGERIAKLAAARRFVKQVSRLSEEEIDGLAARNLVFITRLNFDPGFNRYVWGRIINDPEIAKHRLVILKIIKREFLGEPTSPSDLAGPIGGEPQERYENVRRLAREYYPDIMDAASLEGDDRRRPIQTLFGPVKPAVPAPNLVPAPEILRRLGIRWPPPPTLQHLLEAFPEHQEWTALMVRDWNRLMGRADVARASKYPEDEREIALLDVALGVITSSSIPAYWFLRMGEAQQIRLIRTKTQLEFSENDVQRLKDAGDLRGIDEYTRFRMVDDSCWAFTQWGYPRHARTLATAAIEGTFGSSDLWKMLYHVLAIAEIDCGRPKKALAAARRLREAARKHDDRVRYIIGLLLRIGIGSSAGLATGEEIRKVANEAVEEARKVPDLRVRAEKLGDLAVELDKAGLTSEAFAAIEESSHCAANCDNAEALIRATGTMTRLGTGFFKPDEALIKWRTSKKAPWRSGNRGRNDTNTHPEAGAEEAEKP